MTETTKTIRISQDIEAGSCSLGSVSQATALSCFQFLLSNPHVASCLFNGLDRNLDRVYVTVYSDGGIEYAYSLTEPKKCYGEIETIDAPVECCCRKHAGSNRCPDCKRHPAVAFTDTRPFMIDRATGNLF